MGRWTRKKRTTKSVGQEISKRIAQQKDQEKTLRTLQKENETRERSEELIRKINEEKAKKPTFFKKLIRKTEAGASRVRSGVARTKQFRENVRITPKKTTTVRRKTTKRRVVRRTARVQKQVSQPSLLAGQSFYN